MARAPPWLAEVVICVGVRGAFLAMGATACTCWKGVSRVVEIPPPPPPFAVVPFQERNARQGIPQPVVEWAYQDISTGERRGTRRGEGGRGAVRVSQAFPEEPEQQGWISMPEGPTEALETAWKNGESAAEYTARFPLPRVSSPFPRRPLPLPPPSQVQGRTYKADLKTFQQWNAVGKWVGEEWYFPIRRPSPPSSALTLALLPPSAPLLPPPYTGARW